MCVYVSVLMCFFLRCSCALVCLCVCVCVFVVVWGCFCFAVPARGGRGVLFLAVAAQSGRSLTWSLAGASPAAHNH